MKAPIRLSGASRTWREIHPSSWGSADVLVRSANVVNKYAFEHLENAFANSDAELAPLSDPLRLNLGEHRWLSADREESYSDWLAWILQGMSSGTEILQLFTVAEEVNGDPIDSVGPIRREVSSDDGRTDIEVPIGERGLLLIEVKVQNPGAGLSSQLKRYRKKVDKLRLDKQLLVLLGTEAPEPSLNLFGFVFTSWEALCVRLRQHANRVKKADLLRAAAILIFCGAVEQNLLGFSGGGRRIRAMATVNYLQGWRHEPMRNKVSDGERDFFVTGVRTYLQVDEAMAEFRRLVEHKCRAVVSRRLDDINRACGMHWTVKNLNEYSQKTSDHHYLGLQMELKGLGGLYFCLRISRNHDRNPLDAYVFLFRTRRDRAAGLWDRANTSASVTWKGQRNLGFGRPLPADKIPDFEIYLDLAVTEFIGFLKRFGGLGKYLSTQAIG